MPVQELLISSDSHVDVKPEQVKQRLASKYHEEYDAGVATLASEAAKIMQSNMQREQALRQPQVNPARGTPGHSEPEARLRDMDTDGVEAEVLYCEVSAYRFLYKLKDGWKESTRAFNDTLLDFAAVDPKRLITSAQVPIHDIDFAVQEVRRIAEAGGKSLQMPVFPHELGFADYFDERYDPLWNVIAEYDLPICCHIGLNTGLNGLAQRDPTPGQGRLRVQRRAVGGRRARHVAAHRRARASPEPQGGVRGAGARVGGVGAVGDRRHGRAAGLRVPGAEGQAELVLLPERPPHLHRRAVRDREAAPRARCAQHHVVERLPAPGELVAELAGIGREDVRHRARTTSASSS